MNLKAVRTMVLSGEWLRLYENFGFDAVARNLQIIRRGEEVTGIKMPDEVVREKLLPRYMMHGFTVAFDLPYLDEDDVNKSSEGRKIYYPVRTPTEREVVRREIGSVTERRTVRAAQGFGEIRCLRTDINDEEVVRREGKDIYPFAVFLRTPSGVFYSLNDAGKDKEEESYSVLYDSWKPHKTSDGFGVIYVPADIPSLSLLEFKLLRMNPEEVYKELSRFQ